MSTQTVCDGCGTTLRSGRGRGRSGVAITGERVNGLPDDGPLPEGGFDWCVDCAEVAFCTVEHARAAAALSGTDRANGYG